MIWIGNIGVRNELRVGKLSSWLIEIHCLILIDHLLNLIVLSILLVTHCWYFAIIFGWHPSPLFHQLMLLSLSTLIWFIIIWFLVDNWLIKWSLVLQHLFSWKINLILLYHSIWMTLDLFCICLIIHQYILPIIGQRLSNIGECKLSLRLI